MDFQFKTVVEPFELDGRSVEVLAYEDHLKLIERLLNRFLKHAGQIRVKSLERMVRSIVTRENAMYIAGDCLGKQLAVDPEGGIYNCQRFAGMKEYQWGSIRQNPSMQQLAATNGYCVHAERLERVRAECSGCSYFDICAGGCAYNAFNNQIRQAVKSDQDPGCRAYRGILDNIVNLIGKLMGESLEANSDFSSQRRILRLLMQGIPLRMDANG